MIERYLWIAGSLAFVILETIHLLYTFFTNKFSSRNSRRDEEMKLSHPAITKQITMWSGWIGFNASHSSGVMYIGIIKFIGSGSVLFFAAKPAIYCDQPGHRFVLFMARKKVLVQHSV